MNLEQFKQWAIGQGQVATPANTYLGECVSLVQQYINKVYGIPFQARGHAKDWATNANVLSYFDRVSSPQAGDIGISGATASNPYGHIWIYLTPSTILEQNGRVSRRVSTGGAYANPIAILRRKGTPQGGQDMMNQGENEYGRANKLHRQVRGRDLPRDIFNQLAGKTTWLRYIEILSDDKEADLRTQAGDVGAVAVRDNWQGQITTLQKQFADATKVATELQTRLAASDNTTKALTEKVDALNKRVTELDNPDNIVVSRSWFNTLFDKLKGIVGK